MAFNITYKRYGEYSILIEWPEGISISILDDVLYFKDNILKNNSEKGVEIIQAYSSLLVNYSGAYFNYESEVADLKNVYALKREISKTESRLWKIPVCYDDQFGLDLDQMSQEKNIPKEDIIKLHYNAIYTVYFIGFLPGFLYMGGLVEKLYTPRKSTPRLKIEKGAVAIGGNQTGIYPNASPGGWNIIGNSPINFFDVNNKTPCFAKARDAIQFYPVSIKAYQDIKTLVDAGVYQLESEVIDD